LCDGGFRPVIPLFFCAGASFLVKAKNISYRSANRIKRRAGETNIMENRLKISFGGVVYQVNQAIEGVEGQAEQLKLKLVEAEVMEADLDAFIAGEAVVKKACLEVGKLREAYRALLDDTRQYIFAARDLLKPYYGQRYSAQWEETGFVHSLKVPREAEKLLTLLLSFAAYYKAHPAHENTTLNVTGVRAKALFDDLTAAAGAVNHQITEWHLAINARDEVRDKLRKHMRALLKELSLRLSPLDERWVSFGFNQPGYQPTPDAPETIEVVTVTDSAAALKWEKPPRAKSFRVWKRVVGVDAEMVSAGTTSDCRFLIEPLPADALVEVAISALNKTGESARSEIVVVRT